MLLDLHTDFSGDICVYEVLTKISLLTIFHHTVIIMLSTIFLMLYITSLVFFYLVIVSLYLWTPSTNSPSPHLLPPVNTNLISFTMSWLVWALAVGTIDLQHHVSSWWTTNWFGISIHYKMVVNHSSKTKTKLYVKKLFGHRSK